MSVNMTLIESRLRHAFTGFKIASHIFAELNKLFCCAATMTVVYDDS